MNRNVSILKIGTILTLAASMLTEIGAKVASADEWARYQEYKKHVLADQQEAFAAVVAAHKGDPTVDALLKRMQLIDQVAGVLVRSFETTKLSSLKALAADAVPEISGNGAQPTTAPSVQAVNAADILAKYSQEFSQALPKPTVSEAEMKTVRDFYTASAKAAGTYVMEHSRSIAAVDRDAQKDLSELCLVIPLLHRPDQEWSREDVAALPDWMREPARINDLMQFALVALRPETAYQFELFRLNADPKAPAAPSVQDFLLNQAKAMADSQRETAIRLLRVWMDQSQKAESTPADVPLQVYYAELLDKAGQPALSAEEAKAAYRKAKAAKSDVAGKAAVLRLSALYKAGQYDNLLAEAEEYQKDEICKPYLPQLLYLHWVAARRQNKMDEAKPIEQAFLSDYPDHPLAADIHFANAMKLLAEGDYAGASKVLDLIESKFPGSSIAAKAREIRLKLKSASKD